MRQGSGRLADGRNDERYAATAAGVFPEAKWWAKEKGRPSRPASCAL
jgi:hypothetical protein